jgi:hypothetical protein
MCLYFLVHTYLVGGCFAFIHTTRLTRWNLTMERMRKQQVFFYGGPVLIYF